jgi:hypothetical protein
MPNPILIKTYIAEAAVLPFRIVKWGAADGQVLPAAAATDKPIGVSDNIGQATVNGRVDVVRAGVTEVQYGGTVTRGDLLVSDANGKAVTAAPGAGTNHQIIGRAEKSGVLDDIGEVMIAAVSTQG